MNWETNLTEDLVKVTKNGEITYSPKNKMYCVWDETYSEIVCLTPYAPIATQAGNWYAREILGTGSPDLTLEQLNEEIGA